MISCWEYAGIPPASANEAAKARMKLFICLTIKPNVKLLFMCANILRNILKFARICNIINHYEKVNPFIDVNYAALAYGM